MLIYSNNQYVYIYIYAYVDDSLWHVICIHIYISSLYDNICIVVINLCQTTITPADQNGSKWGILNSPTFHHRHCTIIRSLYWRNVFVLNQNEIIWMDYIIYVFMKLIHICWIIFFKWYHSLLMYSEHDDGLWSNEFKLQHTQYSTIFTHQNHCLLTPTSLHLKYSNISILFHLLLIFWS